MFHILKHKGIVYSTFFSFFFFVQNTIDFRFVQGLGQQNMSGSVSDVVINLAAFDKERRASTKSRVKLYSFLLEV